MSRRLLWYGGGLFSALLFATAGYAVPITIDFSSGTTQAYSSLTVDVDGISVTAMGGTSGSAPGSRWVHQNWEGLGVWAGGSENNDIDGSGPDEFLELTFSEDVRFLGIVLEDVDSGDETALIVDGTQVGFGFIAASGSCSGDSCLLDLSGAGLTGSSLRVGDAISGDRSLDSNDDFRLEAVIIERVAQESLSKEITSSMPEPTAALMYGLGAFVVGYASRRRR